MTLVKMTRQISGTRDGAQWPAPGGTIEVSEEEAESLVFNAQAVRVEKPESGKSPVAEEPTPVEPTRQATEEAEERGVDLADVEGTGAEGKVTKGDVTAHADAAEEQAKEDARVARKAKRA